MYTCIYTVIQRNTVEAMYHNYVFSGTLGVADMAKQFLRQEEIRELMSQIQLFI